MSRLTLPPLVVVMGVSGAGKSAVGRELADRYAVDYADGDDFHPEANIARMASGTPLTDEDRWPWLEAIGRWLGAHDQSGGVVSCSALRRAHRNVLVRPAPRVFFLHLVGDLELIRSRMERREHFMPASLLSSQQSTLEPLEGDENGAVVDIDQTPTEIVDEALAAAEVVQKEDEE